MFIKLVIIEVLFLINIYLLKRYEYRLYRIMRDFIESFRVILSHLEWF